jgi:hypothetical protein
MSEQPPLLLIFLIEHVIEWLTIRPSPLKWYKLRRNLDGEICTILIAVSPTGDVADNFIIAVRKLAVNFSQSVVGSETYQSHQAIVVSFSYFSAVRQETSSLRFDGCLLAQNGLSDDLWGFVDDVFYETCVLLFVFCHLIATEN